MNRKVMIVLGLGVVALICAGVLALMTPQIALWLGGFEAGGATADELAVRATAQPTINWDSSDPLTDLPSNPTPAGTAPAAGETAADPNRTTAGTARTQPQTLDTVTVQIDGRTQTIDPQAAGIRAEQAVENDQPVYYFEYTESELNTFITQQVWPQAPADLQRQVRNLTVDLQPGGAIVTAEVQAGPVWQPVSVVVSVENTTILVAGIDINGQLYENPPSGPIADMLNEGQAAANNALQSLAFTADDGSRLTIEQIAVSDTAVQVLAR